MSNESMKVLQLRWIETVQQMYDALSKDAVQFDVKHKFDEVVLVHNEMVTQFCNTIDNVEAEMIQVTHTIKYLNEATAKLKEQIKMGRYYEGDIEGKFWFGIQSSDDADFFGSAGFQPDYLEYYFDESNLPKIQSGLDDMPRTTLDWKKGY